MNVAIIGCGYVGSAIARYWSQTVGLKVTATTTTVQRVPALEVIAHQVKVVEGNDAEALKSVLQGQDTVLLSVASKGGRDLDAYRVAYLETAQTLASILPQLPQVRHLIYTGSYAVYGDRNGMLVDELTPVAPANENSEILAETEQVLLNIASDSLKVCIIRLGGIYGPERELVKIWSRAAGKTRPGSGRYPTHWVHLDDIVGVIEFIRQRQLDGIYNLVDQSNLHLRELVDLVCQKHGLDPVIWDASQPTQRSYNVQVSNQKIIQAGYQFIHPQTLI